MAFDQRNPKYAARPLNQRPPARHFDKPQNGPMDIAHDGYEIIDQSSPADPFDPFGFNLKPPKHDLGRPVTEDGPDRGWDTTRRRLIQS